MNVIAGNTRSRTAKAGQIIYDQNEIEESKDGGNIDEYATNKDMAEVVVGDSVKRQVGDAANNDFK